MAALVDELVTRVVRRLDEHGIAHRLIGAAALAAHGVPRSTHDIDLLADDPAVLDAALWADVVPVGFTIVICPRAGTCQPEGGDTTPCSRGPGASLPT